VRKHLPSFYKFVHAVHKQDDGIFHDLLEWIESIITFMRTGFGHPRVNYKTGEELRVGIDLDEFVKKTIGPEQWGQIQKEAESLRVYFAEVKDRKREEVRQMAGLDRASNGDSNEGDREQERIVNELRGMGMQQEDVDELEMINWESSKKTRSSGSDTGQEEDEGEFGLKVPKVPMIDTLRDPFVHLMNDVLFRTARE
jgi:phosphopantetheine adenylyltransferase